jgi:hypothetical protein
MTIVSRWGILTLMALILGIVGCTKHTQNAQLKYLFIQTAVSGSLQKQADNKTYLLTLYKVDPLVTYFTEAPRRVAGFMPVANLAKIVNEGVIQTHADGLNSGLIAIANDAQGKTLQYVLDVNAPYYNAKKRTMTYQVTILTSDAQKNMPAQVNFKHPSLFIDRICVSCGGSGW